MFRNPHRRYHIAIAPAIVLLSLASVVGLAQTSRTSAARPFDTVAATAATAHSTLLVGHTKLTNALVLATRPVRERHLAVDALLLLAAALLAAALTFGSSAAMRHARLRVDAHFVRRRGPPSLLIVS